MVGDSKACNHEDIPAEGITEKSVGISQNSSKSVLKKSSAQTISMASFVDEGGSGKDELLSNRSTIRISQPIAVIDLLDDDDDDDDDDVQSKSIAPAAMKDNNKRTLSKHSALSKRPSRIEIDKTVPEPLQAIECDQFSHFASTSSHMPQRPVSRSLSTISSEEVLHEYRRWPKPKEPDEYVDAIFPHVAKTHRSIHRIISFYQFNRHTGIDEKTVLKRKMINVIKMYTRDCFKVYNNIIPHREKCRKLARNMARILDLIHQVCSHFANEYIYLYWISQLISIYISLELSYARHTKSYITWMINRFIYLIQKHLVIKDNEKLTKESLLRMFFYIPDMFQQRNIILPIIKTYLPELCKMHRKQIVFDDKVYVKYLTILYQWMQMEADPADRTELLANWKSFMCPAPTLFENPLYLNHLPKVSARVSATKEILSNLEFLQDLRKAALIDDPEPIDEILIQVDEDLDDESWDFGRVFQSISVKKHERKLKFNNIPVIETLDLTSDDENTSFEIIDKESRSSEIRAQENIVLESTDQNQTSESTENKESNNEMKWMFEFGKTVRKTPVWNETITVVSDSDSDSDAEESSTYTFTPVGPTIKLNCYHEEGIPSLEFDESVFAKDINCNNETDYSSAEGSESSDCSPNLVDSFILRHSNNLRTYPAPSQRANSEQESAANNGFSNGKRAATAIRKEALNKSGRDLSLRKGSAIIIPEHRLPRIVDNNWYRRDSIHIFPLQQEELEDVDVFRDLEDDREERGLNYQQYEEFYSVPSTTSLSSIQSNSQIRSTLRAENENGINNGSIERLKSINKIAGMPILVKPAKKQVKFNENPIGPTGRPHSVAAVKMPIKPAININKLQHNQQSALSPPQRRFASPSSSTSSTSESLKQMAKKEHIEAIASMFSSYQISNPASSNVNANRNNTTEDSTHLSHKSTGTNMPRRRATVSAQHSPATTEIAVRTQSSSPVHSVSNSGKNSPSSYIINDPKLRKKCSVLIERSDEVIKYEKEEIAFINGLLEKQREMQRQRALKREQLKKMLQEERNEKAASTSEMSDQKQNDNLSEPIATNLEKLNESPIRRQVVKKKRSAQQKQKERRELQKQREKNRENEIDSQPQLGEEKEKEITNDKEKGKEKESQKKKKSRMHIGPQGADNYSLSTESLNGSNMLSSMSQEFEPEQSNANLSISNSSICVNDGSTTTFLSLRKPRSKRQLQQLRSRVEVRQCMADPLNEDSTFHPLVSSKPPKSPTKQFTVRLKRTKLDEVIKTNSEKLDSVDNTEFVVEIDTAPYGASTFLTDSSENCEISELTINPTVRERIDKIKHRLKMEFCDDSEISKTVELEQALIKRDNLEEANSITLNAVSKRINQSVNKKRLQLKKQKTSAKNRRLGAKKIVRYYTKYKKNIKKKLKSQVENSEEQSSCEQKELQSDKGEQEVKENVDEGNEIVTICADSKRESEESIEGVLAPDAFVKKVVIATPNRRESETQTENIDFCELKPITDETSNEMSASGENYPPVSSPHSEGEIEISKEMAAAATSLTMLANKKAAMTMTVTITSRVLESDAGEAILATAIGLPPPTPSESGSNITMRPEPRTLIGDAVSNSLKYENAGTVDGTTSQSIHTVSEEEDGSSEHSPLSQQVRTVSDLKNIVEATTVNVIKDATMTLLSFEATATLPTYLFNGESRDVPTPTPMQALTGTAAPASVAAASSGSATAAIATETVVPAPLPPPPLNTTVPSTAQAPNNTIGRNYPSEVPIDSSSVTDKVALSTSDHEVSSTQETDDETAKRNSINQTKLPDILDSVDASAMVQNNQIDTTHHLPERRRLRKFSDEFSCCNCNCEENVVNKKRRKTICSESVLRVQFTSDTQFNTNSGGSSPSTTTTTVTEKKVRKRGRPSKNAEELIPSNTPTRTALRKSMSAVSSPFTCVLEDIPDFATSRDKSSIAVVTEKAIRKRGRPTKNDEQLPAPATSCPGCGLRKSVSTVSQPFTFDLNEVPGMGVPSIVSPINFESIKRTYSKANIEQKSSVPSKAEQCLVEKVDVVEQVKKPNTTKSSKEKRTEKNDTILNLDAEKTGTRQNHYTSFKGVRMKTVQKNQISCANDVAKVEVQKKGVRNTGRKRKQ